MDRYNEALEKMKPVDLSKVSNDDKLVRSTYICTMVCVVWRNSSSRQYHVMGCSRRNRRCCLLPAVCSGSHVGLAVFLLSLPPCYTFAGRLGGDNGDLVALAASWPTISVFLYLNK